jgi:adenylate kinase
VCGGALLTRSDDNHEAVLARLRDYHTKTKPILDLFSRKELIVSVDGAKSSGEVQSEIREKLGLEGGHREMPTFDRPELETASA